MDQKPFQNYPGGKEGAGTYQFIINWIPPHLRYIEPFIGNGAVFRNKKAAPAGTVINDIDSGIIDKWRSLGPPQTELTNLPAVQLLSSLLECNSDTFVYMDPPYPKVSRKSQADIYSHEMTDQDHQQLLELAITANFNCMISTYDNDLYRKMLKGWNRIQFQSQTWQGQATETLYMNYPAPDQLHDYSHLGKDCWDRQRIKRKIQRHVNRLKRLPVHERNAILGSIQSEMSTIEHSQK